MPFSNSWEVWISLHPVQKMHMITWWPAACKRDSWWQKNEGRNGEQRRRGGKEGGVNGNVAAAQWNYINLSECIWSLAFDRNRDGRMWPKEGNAAVRKCKTATWRAADVLWFRARPKRRLFVMPKYSSGKGIALWYFEPAAVTHVVASGHAGLVRVWLMVMM